MAVSKEVRCILFSREEVRGAVADFLALRLPKLQPYEMRSVELVAGAGAPAARVTFSRELGLEQAALSPGELMAAILRLCRRLNIPLSSRSVKKLEHSQDSLVLVMSMNLEFAEPSIEQGAVIHTAAADREFSQTSRNSVDRALTH